MSYLGNSIILGVLMAYSNTARRYGSIAKLLHWSIALGIVTMIPLGIVAMNMPYDTPEALAQKALLFSVHKTIGVALFFLALVRIGWAISQPRPAPLHPDRKVETALAEVTHWLLYGSLILVPLSGWVHHAATTGFAPIWWPFGQSLPFVPQDTGVADAAAALHIIFERVLVVSLLLHLVGALKHHVWDKDDTLRRMLPGLTEADAPPHPRKHATGVTGAVAVWAIAIGIGAGIGVFDHKTQSASAAELAAVESDWAVTDGTLAITIKQMGADVTGTFAEWTAAITFDPETVDDTKGTVAVDVSIGSLTLGSVTGQAMGADYFNAEAFPTAQFTAAILEAENGYVADGVLRLRGAEVPLRLPFSLTLEGDVAQMTGTVTVDRRDFGIGDTMTNTGQLAFEVVIGVTLTAIRGGGDAPAG